VLFVSCGFREGAHLKSLGGPSPRRLLGRATSSHRGPPLCLITSKARGQKAELLLVSVPRCRGPNPVKQKHYRWGCDLGILKSNMPVLTVAEPGRESCVSRSDGLHGAPAEEVSPKTPPSCPRLGEQYRCFEPHTH